MNIMTTQADSFEVEIESRFSWLPIRTGDYASDLAAGRNAAAELLKMAREADNPLLIKGALGQAIEAGEWAAFEIGFTYEISLAAM